MNRTISHTNHLPVLISALSAALSVAPLSYAEKKHEAEPHKEDPTTSFSMEGDRGSLTLKLLIQGGLQVFPNQVEGERSSFALERAQISVLGHLISENFTYLVRGDGVSSMQSVSPTLPGSENASGNSGSVPFLLDALVRFQVPVVGLLITFGRFVPTFGLALGEDPDKLGQALYPLYLIGGRNAVGPFRDVGLEMQIRLGKTAFLGGGVFNGGFNMWKDDNDRKDFLAFFTLRPSAAFQLRASSLFKFRNVVNGFDQRERPIEHGVETHLSPCAEARYQNFGVDAMLGYAMDFTIRDDQDTRRDDKSMGAFAHFGYLLLGDLLELSAAFDWWDPSTSTPNDHRYRITIGPSVHLEMPRLSLRVSYIQDLFSDKASMCESYLGLSDCTTDEAIESSRKTASTLLLEVTLAL
jgi:hypothetical protein